MADTHEISYIGGELDLFALAKNWKGYIKREISRYVTGDVLEVGAGSGYMTTRLAALVGPTGRVSANDLQPQMLQIIQQKARAAGLSNVETVQGTETDARLPENAIDLALLVDVYHEMWHPQEMLRSLRRSLKPGGELVLVEYRKEDPTIPIKPEHKMSVAEAKMEVEAEGFTLAKVDEALVHLQNAFRIYPDDLGTGMAISQIYLVSGRPAEAEKVLASMLERAPDQRGLNYSYAQVLTKLGRGAESLKYLERAVEVDPTFGLAIQQLVEIYQSTNQWQKAAEVLQPLINDDPTNLDFQRQQAFFYLRAGMAEKARARFAELLAADPKDTRTQYYLAESLSDLERYDEADKIYRRSSPDPN